MKLFLDNLYCGIIDFAAKNRLWRSIIIYANRIVTAAIYIIYPATVLYMLTSHDERSFFVIVTPAVAFMGVTFLRRIIDRPRPFEKYRREPVIKREDSGASMPSRHAFSAVCISAVLYPVYPVLAIVCGILAIMLCILRVASGVHYISDVIAGAAIGVLSAAAGWLFCM